MLTGGLGVHQAVRLNDELLDREVFETPAVSRVLIKRWRRHHNTQRPHSSLGYRSTSSLDCLPGKGDTAGPKPAMARSREFIVVLKSLVEHGTAEPQGVSEAANGARAAQQAAALPFLSGLGHGYWIRARQASASASNPPPGSASCRASSTRIIAWIAS